jgi:hypothetical protein
MSRQYNDDLNRKLFEVAPELKPVADSKLAYWEDEEPNSHVVYGDVLAEYLRSTDVEEDYDVLRRIFDLLETLAEYPQGTTEYSVLVTEVLDYIMTPERSEWLEKVRKRFMGEETLRLARIVAEDYGPGREECLRALGKEFRTSNESG